MGKTNRDRSRNHDSYYDDEGDDYTFRKESKKKQKRNRRNAEKNLRDIILSGDYDEYELDEELYSSD